LKTVQLLNLHTTCVFSFLHHLVYTLQQSIFGTFYLLFFGFPPDVGGATGAAIVSTTEAVSRSAAVTVLMSKLTSCEQ